MNETIEFLTHISTSVPEQSIKVKMAYFVTERLIYIGVRMPAPRRACKCLHHR